VFSCPALRFTKTQYKFINYIIYGTFRKLSDTRSQEIIDIHLYILQSSAVQATAIRKRKFLQKFSLTSTELRCIFSDNSTKELMYA